MKKIDLVFVLAITFALFVCASGIVSATIYAPDNYAKIPWAVDAADEGDTIIVRDRTYVETVDVNKAVNLTSVTSTTITVYFNDSDSDIMVLGNANYYEIGLCKSNGAITYIIDKSTGQSVTLGSRYKCLWGAVFPDGTPNYVGGCSYDATWPNRFSYVWSEATQTLTLNYDPNPAASQQITAQVTTTASEDPYFDMRLRLQNNWGYVLDYIHLPSDLVFLEADVEEAILPILPGVVLEPAFFDQNRSYTVRYPGYPGVFADYASLSLKQGNIAIYTLYEPGRLAPVNLGFIHDDEYIPDSTFYFHAFHIMLADGEEWTSPLVRFRVSQLLLETIAAYRADNELDQFPSLAAKLGNRYDVIVKAPLLKADADQLAMPFTAYGDLLAQLPSPSILHPVAFQPGGHDENYPDFLPPNLAWGTTEEFRAMFEEAHRLGLLVMPYTNPTWWDDESPTLQSLPPSLTINDLAVLDPDGEPVYEYYGPRGGYVMSPYPSFVQQRLALLVQQMTEELPSDLLFEDQIGARPWLYDFNTASPDPMAYIEGWIGHTKTYRETLLMTELGFDRLAEIEVGFHGSVLLPERYGYTHDWWGTGTWHPYPLAPLMAHDKVLFYQHDLAPETMTVDKGTLTWNLAFGYMLNYDLVTGGLDNPWLDVVAAFQKYVTARNAGEAMANFAYLEGNVTQTTFETIIVLANWDEAMSYDTGQHTLPPQGVLVTSTNGDLTAGIFTAYNNISLSPGEHYLIEERNASEIIVHQPFGNDTNLTLELLAIWNTTDFINVSGYMREGQLIAAVPFNVTAEGVTFTYQQQVEAQNVSYYRIIKEENYLPIANFTYFPENPVVNETVTFNASNSTDPDGTIVNYEWDFGDGNITCVAEPIITHSHASAGSYNINLTITDDDGATNSTNKTITIYPTTIFDTGSTANPYPSIMGNHTGTIKSNHTVIATKLYTYPCEGTGGHTEYAEIRNATWNATATWKGYASDWHNISFDKPVVLLANEIYNYTIKTGSYPQIHHTDELEVASGAGTITCDKFIDANGKIYTDWIPAIRLWGIEK